MTLAANHNPKILKDIKSMLFSSSSSILEASIQVITSVGEGLLALLASPDCHPEKSSQ